MFGLLYLLIIIMDFLLLLLLLKTIIFCWLVSVLICWIYVVCRNAVFFKMKLTMHHFQANGYIRVCVCEIRGNALCRYGSLHYLLFISRNLSFTPWAVNRWNGNDATCHLSICLYSYAAKRISIGYYRCYVESGYVQL